jgi:hypothetical protein
VPSQRHRDGNSLVLAIAAYDVDALPLIKVGKSQKPA